MPPVTINVVSARSGTGKTTVIERLLPELIGQGLQVAALKGKVDHYNLDIPGKDTWRFAGAGAAVTGMVTPDKYILIGSNEQGNSMPHALEMLQGMDLVLVEGDKRSANPKIEVVRNAAGAKPLIPDNLIAVATDVSNLAVEVPVFSLEDARGLADYIVKRFFPGRGKENTSCSRELNGDVVISKATPSDREDILNLGRQFAGDYLDYVMDRWIKQAEGGLYLARQGGSLTGCCCLSFPSPSEGWLQGMRIHPAYRRQGIAFALTTHLIKLARAAGGRIIRLLTHPDNKKALGLARKAGFSIKGMPVNVLYLEEITAGNGEHVVPTGDWQPCCVNDFKGVMDFLENSAAFQACGKLLFSPGYMYRALTEGFLYRLLEQGDVYQVNRNSKILGVMFARASREDKEMMVSFMDAPDELLPSAVSLLPRWRQEGFRFIDMSLLPGQLEILKPSLERFLGPFHSELWHIMELG